MMDGSLILVDKNDKPLGYDSREECHTGQGRRHRAFVMLLFDSNNNVILHKRKHRLFDGLWDLTAVSHPLHLTDQDETYQEASDRALKKEMGIEHVAIEKIGAFNYIAFDGKTCENEYCAVLIGTYNGQFLPNKNEVYDAKKVKFEEFMKDISENPKGYTPWAVLAAKQFQGKTKHFVLRSHLEILEQELKNYLKVFEPYSKKYFETKINDGSKYSPLIKKYYQELEDFSEGGKKLRGFLVFLGYQIGIQGSTLSTSLKGTTLNSVLPICLAQEILHSFLLIHDDIMDKSDTRRGKPSVHKRFEKDVDEHYGVSQAITLGDIACFEAIKLVNSATLDNASKNRALSILIDVLLETAYGQGMDVQFSQSRPTIAQIRKMTELKTAKYSFVGPLLVGSSLGKLSGAQGKAIVSFGMNVGLAFQLQDDILGVFGNEKVLGKSTLSDMREGKNTILIHKTRELADSKQQAVIGKLWGKKNGDIRDLGVMRGIIGACGALEWCRKKNRQLIGQAKSAALEITDEGQLQSIFNQLAEYVVTRQS